MKCSVPLSEALCRGPITGIADCCARAASGHAAATPHGASSFDHLVGAGEQHRRHAKAGTLAV